MSAGGFVTFTLGSARVVARGGLLYWAWVSLLLLTAAAGAWAWADQLTRGLVVTNLRDQLSWGFYIGNFAFLVGVAAAAVVLVIPAYIYKWGPLKEVVLLGELMAVAAIVMCLLFVAADVGRPEVAWHMLPLVGTPNFPFSMLTWDVLVLNAYLAVNLFVVTYLVFQSWRGRPYRESLLLPIVFLSIPLALAIHTVTAFLFVALPARPFWHGAILAPRFIASAFCSGPALMVLVFLVLRRLGTLRISHVALDRVAEMLAYLMALNLFLFGAEAFKEFYSPTSHSIHAALQWGGTGGHHLASCPEGDCGTDISAFAWASLTSNLAAFVLFLVPSFRRSGLLLAFACALAFFGVYVEKGMGLILPGLTPDALGEVYAYTPSRHELLIGAGIWATGALLFTWMAKVALSVREGAFRAPGLAAGPSEASSERTVHEHP